MKLLKVIILLLVSTNVFSQVDTTKIAFVSYWSIGDSYSFKVTKINQHWNEEKLTKDEKQEYIANFTVTDSTENSYTINWSYENDLGSTYEIPEELLERFSKYKLTEIKYKTSEVGEFLEILNWKEVGDLMNNLFDDIIDVQVEKSKNKQKDLRDAMKPFKQMYSSKQGVEQLVLKELQYIHFPLGVEFDITDTLFYDEELDNMFGKDPIKAKAKIYFDSVNYEEGFCIFKQELNLNPEDTKALLNQVFINMKLSNKETEEALKTAVFEIKDNNTFEYFYYPGIPHRIETIRESISVIGNEKVKRIDKTLIELIYNE